MDRKKLYNDLKALNRHLLKLRIERFPKEGLSNIGLFNLKTALQNSDTFDELYELIEIL